MSRRLHQAVGSWLRHEGGSDDRRAEKALRKVFVRLPEIPVPAGFAERVLARAGVAAAPFPGSPAWNPSWSVRLLLSLSLVLGAVSMIFLPGTLLWLGRLLEAFAPLEMATGALVAVSRRYGDGLAVWRALTEVGGIAASALESPRILVALAASAFVSVAAFRLLLELMVGDRSSYHARSA